jgi:hypothetical protein
VAEKERVEEITGEQKQRPMREKQGGKKIVHAARLHRRKKDIQSLHMPTRILG